MSAGQLPSPMIMPFDQSLVINSKNRTVKNGCVFQIDAHNPDDKIFFTINNNRPQPYDLPMKIPKMTPNQRETILYKKPFWMVQGKRTIKAMSLGVDGRESNVVSRVYTISENPDEKDDINYRKEYKCADSIGKM
jgi:hypothetical protein